jgi:FkbM family methyltransferase
MEAVKHALKLLRSSQPFNYLTTTVALGALSTAGIRSAFIVKHLHRVGTVHRRLPNGRTLSLWSRGDDWVSNQIYWNGWDSYEPETAHLFFSLATKAAVTIDVGAYVGYYTLLAAHANPAGRVHAFEPLPSIHRRLQRNVTLNRVENVECIACAVSDTDGDAEFYHVNTDLPTSSSLSLEFMRKSSNLVCSTLPVTTLDRYVADREISRVDLLKIDTESTEAQVFDGMRTTLERDHPDIICEVLPGASNEDFLEEVLGPLGYQYYLLTPEGPAQRHHIKGQPVWLNYLFSTTNLQSGASHNCG